MTNERERIEDLLRVPPEPRVTPASVLAGAWALGIVLGMLAYAMAHPS